MNKAIFKGGGSKELLSRSSFNFKTKTMYCNVDMQNTDRKRIMGLWQEENGEGGLGNGQKIRVKLTKLPKKLRPVIFFSIKLPGFAITIKNLDASEREAISYLKKKRYNLGMAR